MVTKERQWQNICLCDSSWKDNLAKPCKVSPVKPPDLNINYSLLSLAKEQTGHYTIHKVSKVWSIKEYIIHEYLCVVISGISQRILGHSKLYTSRFVQLCINLWLILLISQTKRGYCTGECLVINAKHFHLWIRQQQPYTWIWNVPFLVIYIWIREIMPEII